MIQYLHACTHDEHAPSKLVDPPTHSPLIPRPLSLPVLQLMAAAQCHAALRCRGGSPSPTGTAAAATQAPASSDSASSSEGRMLEGLSLGPLSILRQRLRVEGHVFNLVAPSDVDAVIDLYMDAVRPVY